MNPITRKLKSRRGASILIALLLFLVCAFVGGAVLMSAYQNASRSTALRREQQNYLAVSSAAQLLKAELVGSGVGLQYITETSYTQDEDGTESSPRVRSWRQLDRSYTGLLGSISSEALTIFRAGSGGDGELALTFALEDYPQLSGVTGSLSLAGEGESPYTVTALLRDPDGGNELKLTFSYSSATESQTTDSSEETLGGTRYTSTRTETTTITWTEAAVRLTSIPELEEGTP